ncbi:hypothetical protein [Polaromonas sp.]|uniref:hypothetical protein n=1 Tax=Polaromonas sp. TaxID=1869339 RepID=UPI002FC8B417
MIKVQANYAVFRTKPGSVSEVYNVGRYIDEIMKTGDVLKFRSRLCIYDSEMILNSLIYPIWLQYRSVKQRAVRAELVEALVPIAQALRQAQGERG